MAIANLLVPSPSIPQPNFSWLSSIGDSIGSGIKTVKADSSYNGLADRLQGGTAAPQQQGGFLSGLLGNQPQPQAPRAQPAGMTAPVTPVQRSINPSGDQQAFINSLLPAAIEESKRTGIDPRIIVAQAAQETGWGRSAPGNNYFGIKSHGQGGGQNLTTHEVIDGQRVKINDSFRQFASPEDSVRGYGDFMLQNPRYRGLREAQGLDNQLAQLQASGYATDPNYSRSVGAIARGIQIPEGVTAPQSAADAVTAMGQGGMQPTAYVDPMVSAPSAAAAMQPEQRQQAPMQVADNSSQGGLIAQGVTPVQQGGVDPSIIQYMLRDRNLREMGLKLWAVNAQGQKASEPWQFVNLPDGTLARANQQTGAVERLGQFAKPKEEKALINLGDGRLFDPNTRETIDAGGDRKKAPNIVELFDEQTGQPYKAQWNDRTGSFERVGGVKARSGMSLTTNPDGTVTLTEGTVGGMPKLTESEGRNSGFYGRGVDSQKVLNSLEAEGTSIWNKTAGSIPVIGNFARSEDAQKYDQAKRNFINAVLRRESGAVIAPEEFANAEQQYFPQPGDGKEVIEQKRRNREVTIQGLRVSSGQGANFALPEQMPQAPRPPEPPSPPQNPNQAPPRVTSPAEYQSLPSGAQYTDPNGNIRTKR